MKRFECTQCGNPEPCVNYENESVQMRIMTANGYDCPRCDGKRKFKWRPVTREPLPKLTAEALAERGIEWPEWAAYAVVSNVEYAYFYDENGEFHQEIPGNWDASDWMNSKIPRPENPKLPDWCKVGSWVLAKAENRSPFYGKIFELLRGGDGASITLDGKSVIGAFDFRHLRPARVRPWTGEEAIGERIKCRDDGGRGYHFAVITGLTCEGIAFLIGTEMTKISLADLAADNDVTRLDGSPCGVLEVVEPK